MNGYFNAPVMGDAPLLGFTSEFCPLFLFLNKKKGSSLFCGFVNGVNILKYFF